jgi:hypothetical protein
VGRTTSVQVFVDDAVRGRLPKVCVKTGAPAEGMLAIEQQYGGIGLAWLLLLLGPVGWVILAIVAFASRAEVLRVELPYSLEVIDRDLRLIRARLWSAVFAIGFAVLAIANVGEVLRPIWWGAAAIAAIVAVVAHVALDLSRVVVRLDASHRWVTLRRVHPDFAAAVRRADAARV